MAVTLKDIAREAGVDPSVVSTVLNGSKSIRVSAKTRERILRLIQEMNYRPNMIARSLSLKKTKTIGVLLYSSKDRFCAALMAEIETAIRQAGYTAHFAMWERIEDIPHAYESMIARRVDGIISTEEAPVSLPDDIPQVIYGAPSNDHDFIIVDYDFTARLILDYLSGLGHREIVPIGGGDEREQEKAFRRIIKEYHKKIHLAPRVSCIGFADEAYQAATHFFQKGKLPDALIAINDVTAMSCISAADDLGIRIPEKLSVIGFDNIPETQYCIPKLTTVGFCIRDMVRNLVEMLLQRIGGQKIRQRRILIRPNLIVRNSCSSRTAI